MIIKTNRLTLRPFQATDWQDLHEYLSDPETVRYEPYNPFTEEESKREAARRAEDKAFLAVCLKETGKLIGNTYFALQQPEELGAWEIGYVFNRAYGGKGYATEAAAALLRYGFEELAAHRIEAHCNPDNVPSWRLLERLHMNREGHFREKAFFFRDEAGKPIWHDAYAYGILKDDWMKAN